MPAGIVAMIGSGINWLPEGSMGAKIADDNGELDSIQRRGLMGGKLFWIAIGPMSPAGGGGGGGAAAPPPVGPPDMPPSWGGPGCGARSSAAAGGGLSGGAPVSSR